MIANMIGHHHPMTEAESLLMIGAFAFLILTVVVGFIRRK